MARKVPAHEIQFHYIVRHHQAVEHQIFYNVNLWLSET